jgi:Flp pilus assembly protein TadG
MTLRDLFLASRRSLRQLIWSTDRGTNGTMAVEFAIIAPALVLMMACTVDLGMGIYRKMQVENAAQAGAEYAIEHGYTGSIANVVSNATTFSGIIASPGPSEFCGCPSSTGITSAACNSTCPSGVAAGTYVTVSAQGTYNTILPYPVIPHTFTFAAQSTVRIQ